MEIIETPDKGQAVVAVQRRRPGDLIVWFGGPVWTRDDIDPQRDPWTFEHSLQIGPNLYLGPSGEIDDLFNHSCDPNGGVVVVDTTAKLIAIRDIEPGDEITFDYSSTTDDDRWTMRCSCGAAECRGIVRDYRWLPRGVRARYVDLGVVPEFLTRLYPVEPA